MDSKSSGTGNKIRRRNFFLYLGVTMAGIFSLSKFPFKIFHAKIVNEIGNRNKVKIAPNPNAVKRQTGVRNIG